MKRDRVAASLMTAFGLGILGLVLTEIVNVYCA